MRSLERRLVVALVAATGGCTSITAPSPAPAAAPASEAAKPATPEDAAKASDKLEVAQLELERQQAAAKVAAVKLATEVELAKEKLVQFDRTDAPLRLDKAKLELDRSNDQLAEAQEELAELQMMYKNADLADKTRDIVLHRSERRLERQKAAVELSTRDLDVLQKQTLPLERRRLELDLAARTAESEDGARGAAIDEMNKRAAVREAAAAVAKAKTDAK